jgi:hypothetical protein
MRQVAKRAETRLVLISAREGQAGMAELADAADSKSAGTWYLGGSTPPPGTTPNTCRCYLNSYPTT